MGTASNPETGSTMNYEGGKMFWERMLCSAAVLLAGSAQAAASDDGGLGESQRREVVVQAKPLLRKDCLAKFEKYLGEDGYKAYYFTIDKEGLYACGSAVKQASRKQADGNAMAACLSDKSRRGAKMPNVTCRKYAEENRLLLTPSDYGLEITEPEQRELSSEEYKAYLEQAEEVLEPKCLAEFKIYLRSGGHKSFYYAMDKEGLYSCGSADAAIAASVADQIALRHCNEHRVKQQVHGECRPYARAYDIVAKPEEFGIVHGLKDFKRSLGKGLLGKVRNYVDEGLDINTESEGEGLTPLFVAAMKGDYASFRTFLQRGGDPKHKLKDDSNLLLVAVMGGNLKIIREALDMGLDINGRGFKGNTPLHGALMKLNLYIGGLLYERGADTSIVNDAGETPLKMLDNFDMDAVDLENGVTVVEAAKNNDLAGLRELLSKPPAPDRQEALDTALYAQSRLDLETFKLLVDRGADVNHVFALGETPLMSAAESGNKAFVEYLLAKGAKKEAKNRDGKTAYDLAKTEEVKALLR